MKGLWGKLCCFNLFVFCLSLASAKNHGNLANEFVNVINENRTSLRLSKLIENPGLGCIALQYIEACNGTCTSNATVNCQSSEDDFTEVYAPNCGVELATFGTISGRIVGCQYDPSRKPPQAFSHQLVLQKKTLSMVKDKRHTEIGIGLAHSRHGPLFWCVLFSSDKINSTFVLEGGGRGIIQKRGCFSGTDAPCSGGERIHLLYKKITQNRSSLKECPQKISLRVKPSEGADLPLDFSVQRHITQEKPQCRTHTGIRSKVEVADTIGMLSLVCYQTV